MKLGDKLGGVRFNEEQLSALRLICEERDLTEADVQTVIGRDGVNFNLTAIKREFGRSIASPGAGASEAMGTNASEFTLFKEYDSLTDLKIAIDQGKVTPGMRIEYTLGGGFHNFEVPSISVSGVITVVHKTNYTSLLLPTQRLLAITTDDKGSATLFDQYRELTPRSIKVYKKAQNAAAEPKIFTTPQTILEAVRDGLIKKGDKVAVVFKGRDEFHTLAWRDLEVTLITMQDWVKRNLLQSIITVPRGLPMYHKRDRYDDSVFIIGNNRPISLRDIAERVESIEVLPKSN